MRKELLETEETWVAAENHHDIATPQSVLDDQFIGTFGTGAPSDKATFIQAVTDGEVDPAANQTLSDQTIRLAGDNAVLVATDTIHRTKEGPVVSAPYRYTATYIKRDGRWHAFALHMVKVPPAPKS